MDCPDRYLHDIGFVIGLIRCRLSSPITNLIRLVMAKANISIPLVKNRTRNTISEGRTVMAMGRGWGAGYISVFMLGLRIITNS